MSTPPPVDPWWADVSSGAVAGIVSGVIVAVLLGAAGFFSKTFRKGTWGQLVRFRRWLGSIRLMTTRSLAEQIAQAERRGSQRALDHLGPAIAEDSGDINDLHDALAAAQFERVRIEGERDAVRDALETMKRRPPPLRPPDEREPERLPLPLPRWSVYYPDEADIYPGVTNLMLRNSVDRSIAREVRLEHHGDAFTFESGAHWAQMNGTSTEEFIGVVSELGEFYGVHFEVSWYDENGTHRFEEISVPNTRTPPTETVWKTTGPY